MVLFYNKFGLSERNGKGLLGHTLDHYQYALLRNALPVRTPPPPVKRRIGDHSTAAPQQPGGAGDSQKMTLS